MFLCCAKVSVPRSEQVTGAGRLVEEKQEEQKPGLRDGKKNVFQSSQQDFTAQNPQWTDGLKGNTPENKGFFLPEDRHIWLDYVYIEIFLYISISCFECIVLLKPSLHVSKHLWCILISWTWGRGSERLTRVLSNDSNFEVSLQKFLSKENFEIVFPEYLSKEYIIFKVCRDFCLI